AEDGIRDKLVTGVQTCALPISLLCGDDGHARAFARVLRGARGPVHVPRRLPGRARIRGLRAPEGGPPAALRLEPGDGAVDRADRSEERRVGEGCGCGRWGVQYR